MKKIGCDRKPPFLTRLLYRLLKGIPAPVLVSVVLSMPLSADEKLVCTDFHKPATSGDFPFALRDDNLCEGLINKAVSHIKASIKVSSLGFGRLGTTGIQKISNESTTSLMLRGNLLSGNPFYRLVARIPPGQSIEWEYPPQLVEKHAELPTKMALLASAPDGKKDYFAPYTISDSPDLYLGVWSNELIFNELDIQIHDAGKNKICQYRKKLKPRVNKYEQRKFILDLCGQDLSQPVRLTVIGLNMLKDEVVEKSKKDVIWIHQ